MRITVKYFIISALVILLTSMIVSSVLACNVPVFRYAFERWPAGQFNIDVYYSGELTAEDEAAVRILEDASNDGGGVSNIVVQTVDISRDEYEISRVIPEVPGNTGLPLLVVRYPDENLISKVIWSGRLSPGIVELLVNSPIRDEIAQRIFDGESAVWILIESGDPERDDAAAETLETNLSQMPGWLTLPSLDPLLPADLSFSAEDMADIRIDFSLLRLSRNDPLEMLFIQMLINSEPDLSEYATEPIAFPIYGRGRVLYALVGGGINRENILEACAFLIGACSCEIKAQNPGVDLLITADWDAGIEKSAIAKRELPSLVSLSELVREAVAGEVETISEPVNTRPEDDTSDSLAQTPVSSRRADLQPTTERDGSDFANASSRLSTSDQFAIDGASAETTNDLRRNVLLSISVLLTVVVIVSLKIMAKKPGEGR